MTTSRSICRSTFCSVKREDDPRRADPQAAGKALDRQGITVAEAVNRVLHLPAVAEKTFLVTIGDRTVTGMVSRDQMGRPVADPGG